MIVDLKKVVKENSIKVDEILRNPNLNNTSYSNLSEPPDNQDICIPITNDDAITSLKTDPGSKVHGANLGLIWGRQDPGGPHVGPMNFAIWGDLSFCQFRCHWCYRQLSLWQLVVLLATTKLAL